MWWLTLQNICTSADFPNMLRIGQAVSLWNGLTDMLFAVLTVTLSTHQTSHVFYCNPSTVCGRSLLYWTVCSGVVKCMGGFQTAASRRGPSVAVMVLESLIYWRESQAVLGPLDIPCWYMQALSFASMGSAALVALID